MNLRRLNNEYDEFKKHTISNISAYLAVRVTHIFLVSDAYAAFEISPDSVITVIS